VPTIPALAKLNHDTIGLLDENRTLSACTSNVLVPFAKTPIPDPDFPANNGVPFYQASSSSLVSLAGESRIADPNSGMFHVQFGAGPTSVYFRDQNGHNFIAQTASPPKGVRPIMPDHRPVDRPGIPCETQQTPDLNAPGGPPSQSVTPTLGAGGVCPPSVIPLPCIPLPRRTEVTKEWNAAVSFLERQKKGLPAVDPTNYSPKAFDVLMKKSGLKLNAQGQQVPDPNNKRAPRQ
jgi:hypothetical protein